MKAYLMGVGGLLIESSWSISTDCQPWLPALKQPHNLARCTNQALCENRNAPCSKPLILWLTLVGYLERIIKAFILNSDSVGHLLPGWGRRVSSSRWGGGRGQQGSHRHIGWIPNDVLRAHQEGKQGEDRKNQGRVHLLKKNQDCLLLKQLTKPEHFYPEEIRRI